MCMHVCIILFYLKSDAYINRYILKMIIYDIGVNQFFFCKFYYSCLILSLSFSLSPYYNLNNIYIYNKKCDSIYQKILSAHSKKSSLNNCLTEVEFYDTLKSGDQIQSTTGDIFMKRKLGTCRPHISHQLCPREQLQKALCAIFLCGIQGKLIKTNFFVRNNFGVSVRHIFITVIIAIEIRRRADIIKSV